VNGIVEPIAIVGARSAVPGVAARIYSWVNYAPTLLALYAVARTCERPPREALLAVAMAVTSSAAIALWGSGKTDLFDIVDTGDALGFCLHRFKWVFPRWSAWNPAFECVFVRQQLLAL
jgi:hypothetical protein